MLEAPSAKTAAIPLRVLIVEDESLVALDLEERLIKLGYEVSGVVDNGAAALSFARTMRVDFVLMDIHIRGDQDGVQTAGTLRETLDLPIVFLTAHADDATLQRAGLTEPFGYVLKPFDERELHATIQMAHYRHRAEGRLRKMERWLATTLRSIGDGVIATDSEGRITFLNAPAEAISGWTRAEAIGRHLHEVFIVSTDDGPEETMGLLRTAMTDGVTISLGEGRILRTRDGRQVPVDDSLAPIRDDKGIITGCVVVFRDQTAHREATKERQLLELKMQEAQRLESLGVLASGIAHDFNNLLVAVTCNASLARTMIEQDSPLLPCLQDIEAATDRAALLCKQMLAYAGKGQITLEDLELSAFTRETAQLFQVAIPANVVLKMDLADDLPRLRADRSQLQQILMNLVMNGAEALEGNTGELTVRTARLQATRAFLSACRIGADLGEGNYLLLEIADTGHGMPPHVLQRIFDPFYTTKFTGRGLGLAAIAGIVRSHGGALAVQSEPGYGTTFQVLFPAIVPVVGPLVGPAAPPRAPSAPDLSWRSSGRALLADDELAIRLVGTVLLRKFGFEVDTAEDGLEAVKKVTAPGADYRFVLLDLTMPRLNGPGALQAIRAHSPDLPVILMSGYSEKQAIRLFELGEPVAFLEKPFSLGSIAAKLQPLLASSDEEAAARGHR